MRLVLINQDKVKQAEVVNAYQATFLNPKYMFCHNSTAPFFDFGEKNDWGEAWAIYHAGYLVGYVEIAINRNTWTWTVSLAINFSADAWVMGRALCVLLGAAFYREFHKLQWYAIVDNPAFKSYVRICDKLNGRMEGYMRDDCKTWDNQYRDSAHFAVLLTDVPWAIRARYVKMYQDAVKEGLI